MKASSGKRSRIRLGADAYHGLHQEILKRDGWRCQACGSLRGLEVHHIQRRSQSGKDSEGNLITLCSNCHRAIHTYWEEPTVRSTTPGWGDLCRERIRYCRNFVFSNLNTLRMCPWMPYHDPERPWVNRWFAGSEGAQGSAFLKAIRETNQDQLEAEGGASILYTHFGHGFVEGGRLKSEFVHLMERLSKKNGWFVPSSVILDHLAAERGVLTLDASLRRSLEWRWLEEKIFRGTS